MCLIVKSRGALCPEDWFTNSVDHNPDGLGVMWFEREESRVRSYKIQGTAELQWKTYLSLKLEGLPHAIHHRFSTHGNKTLSMCHPFRILSKERDGADLYMMHNGVMSGVDTPVKGNSDTWHFIKDYLRRDLRTHGLKLLRGEGYKKLLSKVIGGTNKLLFLDSQGIFTTINRKSGDERNGFWLSNTYSLNGITRWSAPQNTSIGYAPSNVTVFKPAQSKFNWSTPIPHSTIEKLKLLEDIEPDTLDMDVVSYSLVHRVFISMTQAERNALQKDNPLLYAAYLFIRDSVRQVYYD